MSTMRTSLWMISITVLCIAACNYTVGECYTRGPGETSGAGGVILPGGAGGFGEEPPGPQGGTGALDCNATEEAQPDNDTGEEQGLKVFCLKPDYGAPCSEKCLTKGVPCAPLAVHPYKSDPGHGQLFSCNTLIIGFMCGYHYPNGDDCYYPIGNPMPNWCAYSGNQ